MSEWECVACPAHEDKFVHAGCRERWLGYFETIDRLEQTTGCHNFPDSYVLNRPHKRETICLFCVQRKGGGGIDALKRYLQRKKGRDKSYCKHYQTRAHTFTATVSPLPSDEAAGRCCFLCGGGDNDNNDAPLKHQPRRRNHDCGGDGKKKKKKKSKGKSKAKYRITTASAPTGALCGALCDRTRDDGTPCPRLARKSGMCWACEQIIARQRRIAEAVTPATTTMPAGPEVEEQQEENEKEPVEQEGDEDEWAVGTAGGWSAGTDDEWAVGSDTAVDEWAVAAGGWSAGSEVDEWAVGSGTEVAAEIVDAIGSGDDASSSWSPWSLPSWPSSQWHRYLSLPPPEDNNYQNTAVI